MSIQSLSAAFVALIGIICAACRADDASEFKAKVEAYAAALKGKDIDFPPMKGARVVSAIPYEVAKGGLNNQLQCPLEVNIWAIDNNDLNSILAVVTLEDMGDGRVSSVGVSDINILINGKDAHSNADSFKQVVLKSLPSAKWTTIAGPRLHSKHTGLAKIFSELRAIGSLKLGDDVWTIPSVAIIGRGSIMFVGKRSADGKHHSILVVAARSDETRDQAVTETTVNYAHNGKVASATSQRPSNLKSEEIQKALNDLASKL